MKNANKPPFETWLKQISDNDVDGLLFAAYLANFKDTNYITYACPKKSCSNIFIENSQNSITSMSTEEIISLFKQD